MQRLDQEKWKGGRSGLVSFAQRHPGAFTAHFVNLCRCKLLGAAELCKETRDLRTVDLQSWVTNHAGYTETRDVREATTLAYIFDCVNRREISMALDALVMRLTAMQKAKRKGSSGSRPLGWNSSRRRAERLDLPASTPFLRERSLRHGCGGGAGPCSWGFGAAAPGGVCWSSPCWRWFDGVELRAGALWWYSSPWDGRDEWLHLSAAFGWCLFRGAKGPQEGAS